MVPPGDSACGIVARHPPSHGAVPDHARAVIDAHKTAHRGLAAHSSLEAAVFDCSVIDAAQASDTLLFIGSDDFSF